MKDRVCNKYKACLPPSQYRTCFKASGGGVAILRIGITGGRVAPLVCEESCRHGMILRSMPRRREQPPSAAFLR